MDLQNSPWYAKGLQFSCTRCSRCCRHESGYVFLSEADISLLVKHLDTNRSSFLEKYCQQLDFSMTTRISLKEQENFDCIFWKDGGCSVYPARPLQCRSYPFWPHNVDNSESWSQTEKECPGVNVGELHSKESIDDWLGQRRSQPFSKGK